MSTIPETLVAHHCGIKVIHFITCGVLQGASQTGGFWQIYPGGEISQTNHLEGPHHPGNFSLSCSLLFKRVVIIQRSSLPSFEFRKLCFIYLTFQIHRFTGAKRANLL